MPNGKARQAETADRLREAEALLEMAAGLGRLADGAVTAR